MVSLARSRDIREQNLQKTSGKCQYFRVIKENVCIIADEPFIMQTYNWNRWLSSYRPNVNFTMGRVDLL